MNTKVKNQDPISAEDLQEFGTYLITRQLRDEKHAKDIRRLSRRTTTLSDVAVVCEYLMNKHEQITTTMMEVIQVQQKVLEKLGATDEMFRQAKEEYNQIIQDVAKSIEQEKEALAKKLEEEKKKSEDTDGEV
ncbi:hypothetical protein BH753_gp149 [Bacillus phage Shbh1]|uniref:Uncharacterized protein n=1 Tax=Bacillus phage Shbh1 TaxID=1796992 RepID=A0A142F1H4_9CAUD|nr:hypothetical protein BH753_gp149 [Bacillus phage Shbh1]AMQ66631.1 hypothetical protein [Bacillus phage Shbh1]